MTIGAEIGPYRIDAKIGEGGMGVVYKAVDTQLGRPVAVKALSPQLSGNPELVERFRAEARAQARMNHPNVATLYAFLVQDGAAYMVMEYVEGEGVDRMVQRRGPIPAAEALPLFRQALAGVAYAHRLGIVHRDLKPGNLMLNREGVLKVMDFGLAKVAGAPGLTAFGVRVGTVFYMSPEQVMNQPADIRSDIYALGATLYEILTGQVPFPGESEFPILNAHINTPPPRLSLRCADVSPGVEQAVLRAMSKDPADRFQSAGEFAAALGGADDSFPSGTAVTEMVTSITAHPPAPRPASRTRRRGWIAAAAALLAILLAGWLFLRSRAPAPSAARPAAVQPAAPPAPPPAASRTIAIPAGTRVLVRTLDPVDSKASRIGQEFAGALAEPVLVDRSEAFRAHDRARLRLQEAAAGGSRHRPDLVLQLVSVASQGRDYPVTSTPYLVKGGFLRHKRVAAGTTIGFTLNQPVTVTEQP